MTDAEEQRMQALAEGYVSDELSPAEFAELETRLQESEEARLYLLAYLEVHAGLAWEFRGGKAPLLELTEEAVFSSEEEIHSARPRAFWPWPLAIAAAVALLVTAGIFWPSHQPPLAPVEALGFVKESLHGQWADGRAVTAGMPLQAGALEFQSGLIELQMASGTTLLVEAPASLELQGALHGLLRSGSLVVRMPKGRSGFVVDLPQMRVTDLGTEFGVSVAPDGESRVQVFDGKVRAESTSIREGKDLAAGATLRSTAEGTLVATAFSADRFIRRFPAPKAQDSTGGALLSRSVLDSLRIAPATAPVTIDGNLAEWNHAGAFRATCLPPYEGTYFIEGMLMYDAANLYIGAHVGDPEPMRNAAPAGLEFAGGSVIVRVSTDRALGWPLKGSSADAFLRKRTKPALPDSVSDRVVSLILSYDAQTGKPRLRLQYGFDFHNNLVDPPGWRGAFVKDADGRGYTLEFAIPWALLNCADDPPQPGDVLAALLMVHWSDAEGRVCRGQLVDVTNLESPTPAKLPPYAFYRNGPSWGRAIYLPGAHEFAAPLSRFPHPNRLCTGSASSFFSSLH